MGVKQRAAEIKFNLNQAGMGEQICPLETKMVIYSEQNVRFTSNQAVSLLSRDLFKKRYKFGPWRDHRGKILKSILIRPTL